MSHEPNTGPAARAPTMSEPKMGSARHSEETHLDTTAPGPKGALDTATARQPAQGDISAAWLETYKGPRPQIDDRLNRQVRNKVDQCLLPVIFMIYFCQQLDKSSVSFAAVFGFKEDANLQGSEYSWLTSIIYFAQLVFQPLSVYALVRFPINVWVIICFVGWGATCMISAAFTSFPGLIVFRFILGAFEASISPSMMIIVTMWWSRREQPMRNNVWYSANGIALILGSLLAYGLANWDTSLFTYQLIFVWSGAIAVILAIPTWWLLPGHPTRARWLTDEQKYIALERIAMGNTGTQNTQFKWTQVIECLTDPKSLGWVVMVFCVSLVSGGISAFGPLILSGFGLDPFQTILYNMIPGAIGIVANLIAAYFVQHTKRKSPILLGIICFPVAAAAALYALPRGDEYRRQLLAVYFILQIFQPLTPIIFSWAFANTAGHTKKTTTTGILYVGLCVGNIVGPQLYLSNEAPYYKTGLTGNLVVLCVMFGVVILQTLYLMYLNKKQTARRRAMGKTAVLVDYSLEDSRKWQSMRDAHRENQAEAEASGSGVQGDEDRDRADGQLHAWEDKTDRENEDFVYSL